VNLRRAAGLCAAVALCCAPPAAAGEGDIVVRAKAGADAGARAELRAGADVRLVRPLPLPGVELVRPAAGERAEALAALRDDPDVAWAEADQPRQLAADPLFALQWGLENTGASVLGAPAVADADLDASAAWTVTRGAGVTIALVDTGADLDHPDLAGRLVPGWDFVGRDPAPDDANGHGTHIAGILAASRDDAGVAGVAPEAAVMPLRVLDERGLGWSSDVAAAFERAADSGARIVNASLGSNTISSAERLAIRTHPETLFVTAAGNGGFDGLGDDVEAVREFPCVLPEANVLCVGASDPQDGRARFSNYGRVSVDLLAPGVRIASTFPTGFSSSLQPGYEWLDGTSMAAPYAAGVAALVAAARPGADTAAIKEALLEGADRPAAVADASVSGGRLNAEGALAAAGRAVPAPPAGPEPHPQAAATAPPPVSAPQPIALPPGGGTVATAPVLRGVRLSRRTIRCAKRCRPVTLRFRLAAPGAVTATAGRRVCNGGRCAFRPVARRRAKLAAGRHMWRLGPRIFGARAVAGRWRVTLKTSAASRRVAFRVTR
jgi:subtilisin family serine protease